MSDHLPPRGHYRASSAVITAATSASAFRLWSLIAAFNWDGTGCPLSDSQLGNLLHYSRQTILRLRAELLTAGLLAETSASNGQRLLVAVTGTVQVDVDNVHVVDNSSTDAAGFVDNPVDNSVGCNTPVTPILSQICDTHGGKETRDTSTSLPPASLEKGGPGGVPEMQHVAEMSQVGELARLLERRGIYRKPAERIARRAAEAELSEEDLRDLFNHHYNATKGNLRLVTYRLEHDPLEVPDEGEPSYADRVRDEFRSMLD